MSAGGGKGVSPLTLSEVERVSPCDTGSGFDSAQPERWRRGAFLLLLLVSPLAHAGPGAAAGLTLEPGARAALEELARTRPDVRAGEWVTYALEGEGRRSFLRLAVVGEEKDARGRDAYWLEIELGEHPAMRAPMAQMRMLLARGLGFHDGLTRLFVALGFGKPEEVPPGVMAQMLQRPTAAPSASARSGADDLPPGMVVRTKPSQKLLTAAGTVSATPVELVYRQTTLRRLWMSPDVPVLRLARIELPGLAHRMEVREFGLNATPRMILPDPNRPTITPEPRAAP